MQSQFWQRVHHMDYRAREMADRHYSRRTIGAREFTEPGNKIILLNFDDDNQPVALWASQRPDPTSGVKRADNRDVWNCSMFRNERSRVRASDLIREAVAITLGIWGQPLPEDGFFTTVNPRFVQPTKRRGTSIWGYCFVKAGWERQDVRTKARNLVVLILSKDRLALIKPLSVRWNTALFGALDFDERVS